MNDRTYFGIAAQKILDWGIPIAVGAVVGLVATLIMRYLAGRWHL